MARASGRLPSPHTRLETPLLPFWKLLLAGPRACLPNAARLAVRRSSSTFIKCLGIGRCLGLDPLPQRTCYTLMPTISSVTERSLRASTEEGRVRAAEHGDSDKISVAGRHLLWLHLPRFKPEVRDERDPCWRLTDRSCRSFLLPLMFPWKPTSMAHTCRDFGAEVVST